MEIIYRIHVEIGDNMEATLCIMVILFAPIALGSAVYAIRFYRLPF